MALHLVVPDTHVRSLTAPVLADRLTRDLLTSLTATSSRVRIAGYELFLDRRNSRGREPEWAHALRNRKFDADAVTRHDDGTTDVVLTAGVHVHLYRGGAA